ncbi:isochorismate synthase [Aquimarina muelleri]|uniref:isochorismate synthase n=1 Tax=Aquimarina muelleri TaxID=279356 RepID=A0A918JYJ6_9FLAO|nr:isochorismate synthase [Aquimarina muelleri]MCX2764056.1 isochorismate synthase [Aquimarina muelleri]GGX28215.1 hypothetical protein GCM10007384_31910 [Aquimarina muelleri]
MGIEDIYAKIKNHTEQQLPFVIYRKAGSNVLQALLQQDNMVHESQGFLTSGFVFAPFSNNHKTIIIPTKKSEYYSVVIPEQELERNLQTSVIKSNAEEDKEAREKHILLVEDGIKTIKSGSFKKVVLSRKEEVFKSDSLSAVKVFQRLIKKYSNAFVYLWYHPEIGTWLGATPETLISVKKTNFFTMALAGTQPYRGTMNVNWKDKELVEQSMVTSFLVKELSFFIKDLKVSETYTYRAGTLLHLRTDIRGYLDIKNHGVRDVIKILHPTPAVCGLPKNQSKFYILNNESYDRKYYTGFLGEVNMDLDSVIQSNIFVNLRCMEFKKEKAVLYIGGGVTKDSDPQKEWEETVKKTETMKKVLF